jgi:ESX secretion system protein EccE
VTDLDGRPGLLAAAGIPAAAAQPPVATDTPAAPGADAAPTASPAPRAAPARATRTVHRTGAAPAASAAALAAATSAAAELPRSASRPDRGRDRIPASIAAAFAAVTRRRTKAVTRRRPPAVAVGRLVCWELAVLTLLAVLDARWPVRIGAAVSVVVLVATTVIRTRGRLLSEWLGRAVRFLLRARVAGLRPGEDAGPDLVRHLGRHVQVDTVDVDGVAVALVRRPEGVAAVLEVLEPSPDADGSYPDVLSPESFLPAPDVDGPPFAVHVLMHTTPPDTSGPARPDRPEHRIWVTMQVMRTADLGDDETLRAALANGVHRLVRRLGRDDVAARALDREETLALIRSMALLDHDDTEPIRVHERWNRWHAGTAAHACFRVGWSNADLVSRRLAVRRLQCIPSRSTTIAITARHRPGRGEPGGDRHAIVRICEDDLRRLENSAGLLAFALDDISYPMDLERLDGSHQPAVAASLPLGAHAPA